MAKSLQQRFDEKYEPVPESGCWIWTAKVKDKRLGYGVIHIGGRRNGRWHYAHRISWGLYRFTIPFGLDVLHKCDNPSCVNPDHLFLGTQADNNFDRDRKGRHKPLCGNANGNAKLTEDQVLEIRKSRESSLKLAKIYPVDSAVIRKIRRREIWGHI